jgi:hypothetical protein
MRNCVYWNRGGWLGDAVRGQDGLNTVPQLHGKDRSKPNIEPTCRSRIRRKVQVESMYGLEVHPTCRYAVTEEVACTQYGLVFDSAVGGIGAAFTRGNV